MMGQASAWDLGELLPVWVDTTGFDGQGSDSAQGSFMYHVGSRDWIEFSGKCPEFLPNSQRCWFAKGADVTFKKLQNGNQDFTRLLLRFLATILGP